MVFLIAGLGNPGKAYEKTRHNIGFRVVQRLALHYQLSWRKKFFLKGRLAHGPVRDREVYLLLPETYMNLSGTCVVRLMRQKGIDVEKLLVVVDDVALPFGQMRLRTQSGTGGHNGLKSIEASLGTNSYARLRIGIGDKRDGDLANHVLAPFSSEEEKLVPEVLERAAQVADIWLTEGLTSAMNFLGSSQP